MKRFLACFTAIVMILVSSLSSFAHSGRTDSSGGHKDNKNKSGLGSYHYHHGYGPHLHTGGKCPYDTSSSTSSSGSSSSSDKKVSLTSKSTIKAVQKKLNSLGYDCGTADGIIGKKTKAAIKAFEKDNDLKADGLLDRTTYDLLMAA